MKLFVLMRISGGRHRPSRQMEEFRDVLNECGFLDLGYSGNKFTWCNGHGEGHTMWKRLNRAIGTGGMALNVPGYKSGSFGEWHIGSQADYDSLIRYT